MRRLLGIVLVLVALIVAVPAFRDACDSSASRLEWIVMSGVLTGLAALAFARRPNVPPVTYWVLAVVTGVVAISGITFLAALTWAIQCSR